MIQREKRYLEILHYQRNLKRFQINKFVNNRKLKKERKNDEKEEEEEDDDDDSENSDNVAVQEVAKNLLLPLLRSQRSLR